MTVRLRIAAFHASRTLCRCAGMLLFLLLARAPAAAEPNERAVWILWHQHATNTPDYAALLTACQAFTNQNASDPLAPVVRVMAAWDLLQLDRKAEAVASLSRLAGRTGSRIDEAASSLANAWLTRLDRERLKAALQFYYRREVRYPRTIDELLTYKGLPKELMPPREDRFEMAWRYSLVGYKSIPGLLDQKYELSATRLGKGSDLAEALAVPYGSLLRIKPLRMLSSKPGGEIVEWMILPASSGAPETEPAQATGPTMALGLDSTAEGMSVACIGRSIVIVYDTYHWKVFARPPG